MNLGYGWPLPFFMFDPHLLGHAKAITHHSIDHSLWHRGRILSHQGNTGTIRRKFRAYHVHVQLGCIVQGLVQYLAINHTAQVWHCFRSWLRTMNPAMPPSELVVAHALRSTLPDLTKIIEKYYRTITPSDRERMTV